MNKYQEAIDLITRNGLTIKKSETYDSKSGWNGCSYFVCDGSKEIVDLSGNGFCFDDSSLDESMKKIRKYIELKNVNTLDAFKRWADNYALECGRNGR